MTEFRPISCCNVLYKIISKTMANKLKPFLGDIISENQSAFVPKRLITDNALIALEIFHAMKRRGEGRDGSFALKLDILKKHMTELNGVFWRKCYINWGSVLIGCRKLCIAWLVCLSLSKSTEKFLVP